MGADEQVSSFSQRVEALRGKVREPYLNVSVRLLGSFGYVFDREQDVKTQQYNNIELECQNRARRTITVD